MKSPSTRILPRPSPPPLDRCQHANGVFELKLKPPGLPVRGRRLVKGEARTVGNLVYDSGGNSKLGKLKFNLDHLGDNYYINVVTDVLAQFSQGHVPTPYLFALTLK